MNEYYITLAPFPMSIRGAIVPNPDGSYQVYINDRLPADKRKTVLRHEMLHGERNHFWDDRSVADLEAEIQQLLL